MVYIHYDFKCSKILIISYFKIELKTCIIYDADENSIKNTALEIATLLWFYITLNFFFLYNFHIFVGILAFKKLLDA